MSSDGVVHVIDDDDAVRDSISFLLKSAGIAVATHSSASAFLAAFPQVPASCIVTDVRMPGLDGIALLRHLRRDGHAVPVIVITGHGNVPLAVAAMKHGAADFIEKPFDDDALLSAIRRAEERGRDEAKVSARHAEIGQRIAALSERERQVLDGLVAGNPNKTIAYDLGISPRTVEIYRANVMTKMQAGSLSELVRMAIIAGAISSAE